ncbi:hypothetical protein KJ652_02160 [Patescibacteria group bacterium]|nr:hypothetical protein [Patescibacteria group bacterium]MBU1123369.1 hypothetical protein [Patescibacteria group bacterium]MBU1911661.1 hypothetical protein [Patescibacteria group bacterium]
MKAPQKLSPNQIITLHDFPLHSEQVLKLYFRIYQKGSGKIIPPCPVLNRKLVEVSFSGKTKDAYDEFMSNNPQAEYFLLDGSHKTTAAALTGMPVSVMVYQEDKDIKEARELVSLGEIMSLTVQDSIQGNVNELKGYFDEKLIFETVEEKTLRMIEERVIPEYMIEYYHQRR